MATIITRQTGETAVNRALTNAELDSNFINLNTDVASRILLSEKGAAGGVATLDGSGKVPSTQLPSYVDDVLEYPTVNDLPAVGLQGVIYIAVDTNKVYRWSGSTYINITSGAVDSVAGRTGVVTLTSADVGLGNVENKNVATILSELTSTNVISALGYTPYNSTNPSGYITSTALSSYLALSGGELTGALTATTANGIGLILRNSTASTSGASTILFQNKDGASNYRNVARISGVTTENGATGDFLIENYYQGVYYKSLSTDKDSKVYFYDTNNVKKFEWDATNVRALINSNIVLHAGNYSSYALPLTGGTVSGNILNSAAYSAPNNASGAGTGVWLRGSTGTGQAGSTGGHGYILLSTEGASIGDWTSISTGKYRGGIGISAGTANRDATGTYKDGADIIIRGSFGTSNATQTGIGTKIQLISGGTDRPSGVGTGSSVLTLNGGTASSSGSVSLSSGPYNSDNYIDTNQGAIIILAGATASTGSNITLRPGSAGIAGSTAGKAYISRSGTDYEIIDSGNYSNYITGLTGDYLPLGGGTLTGSRTIQLDTDAGSITTKASTGIWATGTFYKGSGGTTLAGFGAYGTNNALTYAWIGSSYSNTWLRLTASAINTQVALYEGDYRVLNADNYTNYSPTLTGSGASGTWGISITGSSASAGSATTVSRGSGNIATVLSPGSGTYNQHVVYATASEFGIESALATDSVSGTKLPLVFTWRGGYDVQGGLKITGSSSAELGGNTVLHTSNYSSYALPLTGGTLTGKLNLSGGDTSRLLESNNASAVGSPAQFYIDHSYGNVNIGNARGDITIKSRTSVFKNSRTTNYTGSNLELFTDDNTPPGLSFHRGGYSATLLYESDGELYVNAWTTRSQSGKLLSSGNYSSYALPLTGGTLTGNVSFAQNAGIIFGTATSEAGPWTISVLGSGGATPATKGTGRGRNLIIKAGDSDNGAGLAGGDLFLRGGSPTSPSVVYGDVRLADLGGQVYLRSGEIALGSGNYTSYVNGTYLRAAGHPGYGNWNDFGNTPQTVHQIYQENFNAGSNTGSSNFPSNSSYNYGTLINFSSGDAARAQMYVSHAGNDLIFRGGWYSESWTTWNKVLTDQNYGTYALALSGGTVTGRLTVSNQQQFGPERRYYVGNLTTGATPTRYEIARVYIDYNDWHSAGTIQVELQNNYYAGGDRQVWNISFDYNNVHCDLVESIGPRGRWGTVTCGSPTQVSGDSYYIPVYVDVRYYGYYHTYVTTSWPEVTSHAAHTGHILVYTSPTSSSIGEFTPSDAMSFRASSLSLSGNAVLHASNYSSYAQPVLISGTNIKTINGTSILGSGDISISGGSGGGVTFGKALVFAR